VIISREDIDADNPASINTHPMKCVKTENGSGRSTWEFNYRFSHAGARRLGVRVIPRSSHEGHKVDLTLGLVKWL
jgi:hypothetical protein